MLTTADIREKFLKFFEGKGHTRVSSASLVPENDPTLLFSNAGMNQFKDVFLGSEKRPYSRATSSQKCLRISGKHNDFENVGVTARHHTFFEMLGNFSFGDYFKAEAIEYGWEFVTEVLKLPKCRLWVTVFEDDDEAEKLWLDRTDIKADRIVRMGEKENFWSMGDTGPCGPCSEIHFFLGEDGSKQSAELLEKDDGSFVEIWNLVFMQFNRDQSGKMTPLPKPSVDTGMGLERVAAVCQGFKANYDADLLRQIIALCEKLSGFKYDGSSYEECNLREDVEYARDVAMRVVADHSRAIAFLIADGVHPGSDGRSYVLRRMIRRAVRHGRVLNFDGPFLAKTTKEVINLMGHDYPELVERSDIITKVAHAEEVKFHETLEAGLAVLTKEVEKVKAGELFPGEAAFLLHDTYGFPLDLTQDALKAYKLKVDENAFKKAMAAQKARSREDRKSQDISFASVELRGPKTKFIGYDCAETETKITHAVFDGNDPSAIKEGAKLLLFFEATPFYAESGGQVGDTGEVLVGDTSFAVYDTQKMGDGYIAHCCTLKKGKVPKELVGENASLKVNAERRERIKLNHSATHLLHNALRHFLGDHVKQSGSRVDEETLRFDYSHFEPVSAEILAKIQAHVNAEIRANHAVKTEEMALEKAKDKGAIAFFGDKYGETVRVVKIGASVELCGGTHAGRSGDIGLLIIKSDSGIAAGVRRIECLTGPAAYTEMARVFDERATLADRFKVNPARVNEKVMALIDERRNLEKELNQLKTKFASSSSSDLAENVKRSPSGVKVIAEVVSEADTNTLREMVDRLRLKVSSGVVALASSDGKKASLVVGITSDLKDSIHAGKLVKEAASAAGGKGGGRPDFAQAGGLDADKMQAALDKVFSLIE